jgi:hypothetical protein
LVEEIVSPSSSGVFHFGGEAESGRGFRRTGVLALAEEIESQQTMICHVFSVACESEKPVPPF